MYLYNLFKIKNRTIDIDLLLINCRIDKSHAYRLILEKYIKLTTYFPNT